MLLTPGRAGLGAHRAAKRGPRLPGPEHDPLVLRPRMTCSVDDLFCMAFVALDNIV